MTATLRRARRRWSLLGAVGGARPTTRSITARNKVDEAWSGVDVQLKRRHDLVPNLVETVKGYAAHERVHARGGDRGPRRRGGGRGAGRGGARRGEADDRARRGERAGRGLPGSCGRRRASSASRPSLPGSRTRSRPRAASTTRTCRTTTPASRCSRRC